MIYFVYMFISAMETGFLVSDIADLLSILIVTFLLFRSVISAKSFCNHIAYFSASVAAINSASQDDRATVS